MPTRKLTTIDLFAGVGGIRIGFERAGFETLFANDFDPYCKATYDLNFKDVPLTVADIIKLKSSSLPNFDVLLGGFPCQPFSIAGYRRGFLDTGRGNLFFEIIRILRDKKPRAVFLENVKNLKSHDKGRTFNIISEALDDHGYRIKTDVLNSMEYGNVPQNRERIYIVGFRSKKACDAFRFPDPIPLTKSVSDFLDDGVDEKYYYRKGHPYYRELIKAMKSHNTVYQWRRVYVRENKKGVCPTLTANMGMGGHNVPLVINGKGIRKITPRECARLQGFSEKYRFPNIPETKIYKQFGNSVTVPVIERIARQMRKALETKEYVYREPAKRTSDLIRASA